jgi:DNA polymerase-3 subunit epsilon
MSEASKDRSSDGVSFTPQSALIDRALSAIGEAPRSTTALAREVFGLLQAPPGLAARLVYELLGNDRRASVDAEGVWRLGRATAQPDVRTLSTLRYAVVDVETTGGAPGAGGRVIEIAIIDVAGGRVVDEFVSLIDPGCGIPRFISRLTGITDPMLRGAPRFDEICDEIRRRLEGRVFVAHNATFDWRFVSEEMRRARAVAPAGPRLCTVHLVRRTLPGLRRRGLDSVARYYDVAIEGRHRAGGDARATAEILIRLIADVQRRGINEWGELQNWLAVRRRSGGKRKRTGVPPLPAAEENEC